MDFFAVNGKRPTRLCEATRRFAYESLNHRYGMEARATPSICLDGIEGFAELSEIEKYDICTRKIAELSPVRICEGELLSGAATLGKAIDHRIPATYGGEILFDSVSHLTVDFETVLKIGINGIRKKAEASLEKFRGTDKEAFVQSCLSAIDSMKCWHSRYLDTLKDMADYADNYNTLKRVPFDPPRNFREAIQSLWFTFAFIRLNGNWPGIGRIDYLLGDYLEKDLESGAITLAEARELVAHLFIKGCEWICGIECGSGDAQHYQNIILAGIGPDGKEVTNNVTYLVLDVIEELGISDFPTTVRINRNTPEKLLHRVSEVIRLGGGVVAVYNEDLVIESLTNYGYKLSEARKFANDGCWEVQIPGKTYFAYKPFDALAILQNKTLDSFMKDDFNSFDELYAAYIRDLEVTVNEIKSGIHRQVKPSQNGDGTKVWGRRSPCTVVSLFEEGCIEKGLSYYEGGPVYHVVSPHIGGLPDVANSLYAIKKLVFDDGKLTFSALMEALRNNWEGSEHMRLFALNKYSYFGNDNDEVDEIAANIVRDFANICDSDPEKSPIRTPAGVSTFGRQLVWSPRRMATTFGKRAHDVLSGNFSPTPSTDKEGATAIIKSYCKSDLSRTVSGAALDIKLLPTAVNGENGIEVISSLIRGFVKLGGHFMQLDIADTELLRRAQENPEEYQNLSVRVSGWNARFVTLNKEWQDMIIAQTGCEI